MSFRKKILRAEFSLATGVFSGAGNAAQIDGLRMSASIEVSGGVSSGLMALSIWGLPLSMMNQMSTVGTQLVKKSEGNLIQLYAGEEGSEPSLVFSGMINDAFVDASSMPDVAFRIAAVPSGDFWSVVPTQPISKPGPQKVVPIFRQLAAQMGLTLEAPGVDVTITNPYYGGAPWNQAVSLAQHANLCMFVERGKMVVLPRGVSRLGKPIEVSRETGMVGYPAFRQARMIVQTLLNPVITCQSDIEVKSDLTPACGKWRVNHIIYELESLVPHGRWFQTMECIQSGG